MNDRSGCKPSNMRAILEAKIQASGKDLFTEAERVNEHDENQHAWYESTMAKEFGLSPVKPDKSSVLDVIKKRSSVNQGAKNALNITDDRLYADPSKQFSKRFYGALDRKIQAWQNSKNPTRKTYNEMVAKPVNQVLKAIDSIVVNTKTTGEMNAQLARFGIKNGELYDARDYLTWLAKGGHLQKDGEMEAVTNMANNLTKAQAYLNIAWTLGHAQAFLRIASHYMTRPGGFEAILEGLHNGAIKEGPLSLFKRHAKLTQEGVYGTQYKEFSSPNRDPFAWGITAQKNLVYHIETALGGDTHAALRDLVFDSKPWDQAKVFRSPVKGLVFGLARYPINETRWIYNTAKAAMQGDGRAAANFALFAVLKGAIFGSASLIPSPIYMGLPKQMKDDLDAWQEKHGINLIKIVSGNALQKVGINASVDLTEYTQPLGGMLGARLEALVNTARSAFASGARAVVSGAHGKVPAAGFDALATLSALRNLGMFSKYVGWIPDNLNSTTLTKVLETAGRQLDDEFSKGETKTQLVKAVVGQKDLKSNK